MSRAELNAKKDFSKIYQQYMPFEYLKEMRNLDYRISDYTSPLYQFFAGKLHQNLKRRVRIFDIGSSYGINSALMTFDISMNDLDNFFLKNKPPSLSKSAEFFQQIPKKNSFLDFYLLDTSYEAVKFASLMGLCKESYSINLEERQPSPNLKKRLPAMDFFISTGCVGYVTEKTFEKIFDAINYSQSSQPDYENVAVPNQIFAFSLLRMFPVEKIKKTFEKYGFVLQKCDIPQIKQRRFYDEKEKENVISILEKKGLNTNYLEKNGNFYADFYVGGPAKCKEIFISWIRELESASLVPEILR